MKYVGTLIWSALLITMVNYVVSAIQNVPFEVMEGIYLSIVVSILIFVVSALIPDQMASQDHH